MATVGDKYTDDAGEWQIVTAAGGARLITPSATYRANKAARLAAWEAERRAESELAAKLAAAAGGKATLTDAEVAKLLVSR